MEQAHAGTEDEPLRTQEETQPHQALAECRQQLNDERQQHASTRQALAFYREILDALPTPIFAKNAALRFVFFNRAYEAYFGIERADYLGKTVLDLSYLPTAERHAYQQEDAELLRTGATATHEKTFSLPDGGTTHAALYWSQGVVDAGQRAIGLIGMIVDITEQRTAQQHLSQKFEQLAQAHEQARTLSLTDELTGLNNRRGATLRLQALVLQQVQGEPDGLSVIMLDLDHFKQINDNHGHDAGDRVLQGFADILRGACRQTDTVARIGGEEFLCLLPGALTDTAWQVAECIRHALAAHSDTPCAVRCSAGIACFAPGDTTATLLKRADDALYHAKQTGRNRAVAF